MFGINLMQTLFFGNKGNNCCNNLQLTRKIIENNNNTIVKNIDATKYESCQGSATNCFSKHKPCKQEGGFVWL